MNESTVRIKEPGARVFSGSPWIYRGEIYHSQATPGSVVTVLDAQGREVGKGFFNPRSIIAVRLLTRIKREKITAEWFQQRVKEAIRLRKAWMGERNAYRVFYAEADGIPGLVVDRYGPMLVVEVLSLGLIPYMEAITATLVEELKPQGIYERGDVSTREHEGLPRVDRLVYGELVDPVSITEHDVRMTIEVTHGQKTGHFLDQYENRMRVAQLARGKEMFDAFCHTGGFGLVAAKHGAKHVVGIDQDKNAIARATENAEVNHLADRMDFVTGNAFDWLRKASDGGLQYDLGVLDPPAFTKSKESVPQAIKGYKEINLRAMKLLRPGGILVTASCSYHMSESDFIAVISSAAQDVRRFVRIMEIRGQGPDHPMLPGSPESRYLKCLILTVE